MNSNNNTTPRILRKPEVIQKTGVSYPTLWRLMQSGDFPVSVKLGARAVGWLESDVNRWIESRQSSAA
jgi:prophage regulatory protein